MPETQDINRCISCGHCVAICPSEAVLHSDFPHGTVNLLVSASIPTYQQLRELLRARRSNRSFTTESIETEAIEKIIDAAHLAPSAHNAQTTQYLILQDKAAIAELSRLTGRCYEKLVSQLERRMLRPLLRLFMGALFESALQAVPEFKRIAQAAREGKDPFFHNAPCLIIAHAAPTLNFPEVNAALALHNATLAAQSLGLASFLVGYLVGACLRNNTIPKHLGLPPKHRIHGALAIGHPKLIFHRWIQRSAPKNGD